jgi:hypothetical protein
MLEVLKVHPKGFVLSFEKSPPFLPKQFAPKKKWK